MAKFGFYRNNYWKIYRCSPQIVKAFIKCPCGCNCGSGGRPCSTPTNVYRAFHLCRNHYQGITNQEIRAFHLCIHHYQSGQAFGDTARRRHRAPALTWAIPRSRSKREATRSELSHYQLLFVVRFFCIVVFAPAVRNTTPARWGTCILYICCVGGVRIRWINIFIAKVCLCPPGLNPPWLRSNANRGIGATALIVRAAASVCASVCQSASTQGNSMKDKKNAYKVCTLNW